MFFSKKRAFLVGRWFSESLVIPITFEQSVKKAFPKKWPLFRILGQGFGSWIVHRCLLKPFDSHFGYFRDLNISDTFEPKSKFIGRSKRFWQFLTRPQIWFRLGDFGEFRVIFGYFRAFWGFCGQPWGLLVRFWRDLLETLWRRSQKGMLWAYGGEILAQEDSGGLRIWSILEGPRIHGEKSLGDLLETFWRPIFHLLLFRPTYVTFGIREVLRFDLF